jgi:hypothetical protein
MSLNVLPDLDAVADAVSDKPAAAVHDSVQALVDQAVPQHTAQQIDVQDVPQHTAQQIDVHNSACAATNAAHRAPSCWGQTACQSHGEER